jgi:hypothetical protein
VVQLQRFFYFTCLLLYTVLLNGCVSGAQTLPTPTPLPAIVKEKDIFTVRRTVYRKRICREVAPPGRQLSFSASGFVAGGCETVTG